MHFPPVQLSAVHGLASSQPWHVSPPLPHAATLWAPRLTQALLLAQQPPHSPPTTQVQAPIAQLSPALQAAPPPQAHALLAQ
jgi:hypothetical protein